MDGLTELAIMLKERDNKIPSSMTTGIVISPPPEVQIQLNEVIILKKHHLIFAAHMLKGYIRTADIEGDIKFQDTMAGTTTVASLHSHELATVDVDTNYEAKIKMTTTDTIGEGDEVILMPTGDDQLYFVLDKAVRFE